MGKRKGFLTWKEFLIVIICFVLTPVILNYVLFTWRAPRVYGDGDTWLGFWGNYSGAFVGALVALWIANRQVNDSRDLEIEKEQRQRKVAQLQPLIIASRELDEVIWSLRKINILRRQGFESARDKLLEQKGGVELTEDELLEIKKEVESKVYKLRPINDNLISCLHLIDNIDLQATLYSKVIQYQDFLKVLLSDISEENLQADMIILDKQNFWETFTGNYIVTLESVKNLVDDEITRVKEYVDENFNDGLN
ncbi:hypothetical protein [Bacillus toyonensis]|uniref:Uncharacterized protein n=1 Tax=Bacillus toyonensis TaxID=155322 RepID=A0A2B5XUK1_9BACI|nr:hypothetical protein [Bacillus toyonensis]PGA99652.1 hypothetical protein COL93_20275 [Bacillus toyonensis]PHD63101.1 hypothetical protein COF40_25780 [Bacillus toyonensis]